MHAARRRTCTTGSMRPVARSTRFRCCARPRSGSNMGSQTRGGSMKIPCIVASAALAAFALPTHAAPFSSFDIGDGPALERLKRERPTHYVAVSEAIRVASRLPCPETELQVLKARHDVREMACGFLVKTSYPAKRRI